VHYRGLVRTVKTNWTLVPRINVATELPVRLPATSWTSRAIANWATQEDYATKILMSVPFHPRAEIAERVGTPTDPTFVSAGSAMKVVTVSSTQTTAQSHHV
jgi:hypothetical protein